MTDKIRWGILSTANIGKVRVIPAIQQSNNGEVVAVASRTEEKARSFAESLNIPTAYGSYEALIADPNIDTIYIPLPNSEHAKWSIRCAEAGKPTLCEKPLASNATEAQQIVDAFKSRDVPFAEAFMYRFHPQTQRVKQMVDDGAVGTLHIINAAFTFAVRDETNIRLSKELEGGSVMDVGCYCINVMRHLTGEEPTVAGAIAHFGEKTGVDEWLAGTLKFPSQVTGHFDSSLRSYRTHMVDIRGSSGRILVEQAFTVPADKPSTIHYWHGDEHETIEIAPANHYQLMVEDFADALINHRSPRFDAQDAVENMRVIDSLLTSARAVED